MKREHGERGGGWYAGLLIAVCGCAGNVQVVKPDDMSAAEHRQEAKREQAAARQLDGNIIPPDPLAWQQPTEAPSGFIFPVSPLNPEVSGHAQVDSSGCARQTACARKRTSTGARRGRSSEPSGRRAETPPPRRARRARCWAR